MDYAVRITRPFDEMGTVFERIATKCKRVLVYQHDDSSRVHCHILLVECEVSTDTLKNYIKEKLGVIDKKDWSFKKCNEFYERYITYMSKGKLNPLYNKGFEEKCILEKKNEWIEKKKDIVQDKKKKSKTEYWGVIEEVRNKLTWEEVPNIRSYITGDKQMVPKESYEQVYWIMIQCLEKHKIRSADYEIKRWFHTIVRPYSEKLAENILKTLV